MYCIRPCEGLIETYYIISELKCTALTTERSAFGLRVDHVALDIYKGSQSPQLLQNAERRK